MPYPWFAPKMQVFESGEVQDMCGEDVSFCLDAKEAGYEIWCDPRVRVGHEKQESYSILIDGKEVYSNLSQNEYFDQMEDLAIEFYKTGSPHPDTVTTKINKEE